MKITVEGLTDIFSQREPGIIEKHRYNAVLMPLVRKDGEVYILFETRSMKLKNQPGEVCFPGGRIEQGESARETAVRETCEELGINPEDIRVICEIDGTVSYSHSTVFCFMGEIAEEALGRMHLSEKEVEDTFLVPLSFFMENDPYLWISIIGSINIDEFPYEMIGLTEQYNWGGMKTDVPIWNYHDGIKMRAIWGLTGRLIRNFVKILKEKGYDNV